MTTDVDIVNRALQSFGSRVKLTAAQLSTNSNNEAIQANLSFVNCRDSLLRLAPWDCGMKTANLVYITSVPGTPENMSPVTNLWAPGQPRPPWAYEYQYPVDCLKACWIIPATQTGYAGGVPITTAVTGGAPTLWNGAPIRFAVGTDKFLAATEAGPVSGGSGYAVGDLVTLANDLSSFDITNKIGSFLAGAPQGAPAILRVSGISPGGVITDVEIVSQVIGASPAAGGSYFYAYEATPQQASTTGAGVGATFGLNLSSVDPSIQRVIYTNQEFATLCYVQQVTDPNVWDPMFSDAFVDFLGATICYSLTGDKKLANQRVEAANQSILEARKADGNEGLTINNVTPDWIRGRGITWADTLYSGPWSAFDWGGLLPMW